MVNDNRGRDRFQKNKKIILLITEFWKIFPLSIRVKIFVFFRMTKGMKGILLRYTLLKSIAKKCGDNVSIHPGVYLLSPNLISVGKNVSIHPMCYIDATGDINIGDNVSIAHGVSILSSTHNYQSISIPIKDQGIKLMQTNIKSDVWIGAKATILAGITISEGSIVGANSVVTKNTTVNSIVVGAPATTIGTRNR